MDHEHECKTQSHAIPDETLEKMLAALNLVFLGPTPHNLFLLKQKTLVWTEWVDQLSLESAL